MIITELEVQKLKELVVQLSEKIENSRLADADQGTSLLKDLQNSIMEFTAGEQSRRKLNESLFKVDKSAAADNKDMTTIEEEGSDTSLGDGTVNDAAEQTPKTLLNQSSLEVTMRRAALSKELENLNRVLQAKEELASKISMNDQHLEVMKAQFEATNRDLEREIAALKKERDELSTMVASQQKSAKSPAANSVAEQRRKRIQELEDRVSQLRKKVDEQTRVIRLKEDAERSAKKLQQEISNMKQARVQLMKRMKEESERHRRQQTECNREVRALRMRQQQQSAQMARMERQNAMRINVLQRRMEEALAAKNRLEAAQRRRLENRANASGFDSMALRVKNWLQSELLVVTESKKLEHHLASLIEERKAIAMEIHIVEKQLKDPDMAQADRVEHDARLHELKSALKEHNDDIAKLQQKILDVDPERHLKNVASNVTDIIESRAIITNLFEMLVTENMTTYTTAAKLREQERATAEGQKEIRQLQAEFQQAREDYDMKLTNLLKEHQEEKLVFLKHSANATLQSNPDLDTSIVEKLESQVQELSRLQYVHDELKKKSEEVEALERELASVKGGRVAFFEEVSSVKKPKKKPETSKTGNKMSSFTFADLDTTIDFDSDGENDQENDPDWVLGSERRQPNRKRKSNEDDKPKNIKVRSCSLSLFFFFCVCLEGGVLTFHISGCLQVPGNMPPGALRVLKKAEELLFPLPVQGGVFCSTTLRVRFECERRHAGRKHAKDAAFSSKQELMPAIICT
ncbi:hypothetical protein MRX96_035869 [Rhipicephalus microplus]